MNAPKFENRLSWSAIIPAAVMAFGLAVTWGQWGTRISGIEAREDKRGEQLEGLRRDVSRLQVMEGRMDQRLQSIEAAAGRTEAAVADILRILRGNP